MASRVEVIEGLLKKQASLDLPAANWDDLLHEWILLRFGWDVPRKAVCRNHVAPFRFIADLFFQRVRNVVAFASRDSGKTLDLGILFSALLLIDEGIDCTHVGAVQFQAGKCFEYVDGMVGQEPMTGRSKPMSGKGKFHLESGSKITILTGTTAGCQAEHPNIAGFDEVRHSNAPVLEEWKSMVQSSPTRQAQTIITSTRGAVGDLMDQVLERADAEHRAIYAWCVWEVAAQCVDRSCKGCERYVSHDRQGRPHTFAEVCGGKMRESRGFMPWQDIIDKFVGMFHATWVSQWECKRPEQIGAYYAHYQPEVHNLTDVIADWRPSMGRGLVLGLDFGVADPNALAVGVLAGPTSDPWKTIVWCDSFEDGDGDTIVESWPKIAAMVEQYRQGLEPRWRDNVHWFGDPAGRARQNVKGGHSAIKQIKNSCGVRVRTSPRFNSYQRRHDAVENRLRVRSDGEPRVYFRVETPGGKRLARCIEALRRPLGRDGQPVGEEFVHDEHSHLATAVEFATVGGDYVLGHAP